MLLQSELSQTRKSPIHHGPQPGIVAIVFFSIFALGVIATLIMTHGSAFPRPNGSVGLAQQYYLQYSTAVRLNGFLQYATSIPLGIFTAAVTSRLSFLGVTASGVRIALFGGISASVFIALSGLSAWVLSQPEIANSISTMRAMQLFGFATGGIGYVASLGLLLAGVSVPSLFGNFLPKWLAWTGLVIAGIAMLSTISLVFPQTYFLSALGRFPEFFWMIAAGFSLPRTKI
jgi:hypothetical protein